MMGLHQLITDYSLSYMELYVILGHPLYVAFIFL